MIEVGEKTFRIDNMEAKRVFDEYRAEVLPLYGIGLTYWNHHHEAEPLSIEKIEQVLSEELGSSAYEILVIMNNAFAKANRLRQLERQDIKLFSVSVAETPQILFNLVSKIIEKRKIEQENRTLKEAISLITKGLEEVKA